MTFKLGIEKPRCIINKLLPIKECHGFAQTLTFRTCSRTMIIGWVRSDERSLVTRFQRWNCIVITGNADRKKHNTWRRSVEKEMKENSWTWGHLERRAPDRSQWRALTEALRVSKQEEEVSRTDWLRLQWQIVGFWRHWQKIAGNCKRSLPVAALNFIYQSSVASYSTDNLV